MSEVLLEEKHVENRMCDWRCVQAVRPKCRCRCGGANHGRRQISEEHPLTLEHLPQVAALFEGRSCASCGADLKLARIFGYPHDGGVWVSAMRMRLWVYAECPSCFHMTAPSKLGGGL